MNWNQALTHSGKFHADDVFSSALLKMWNPDIKISRSFQVPPDFDGIVFDIGFGEFDHHQIDAPKRKNGVTYASFGLLWRYLGNSFLEEADVDKLDYSFIQPIDEDDNTGCGNFLADAIDAFNPNWDEEKDADTCFFEAVEFAQVILQKKIEKLKSIRRAKTVIDQALETSQDQIVILPQYVPWKTFLNGSGKEFVIYPSQRGGFCSQPIELHDEMKMFFPKEWAGKEAKQLQKISGIPTLSFCHNGRFLITTGTLQDAVNACEITKMIWDED